MKLRSIWGLLKETVAEWQQDKVEQMAAALAYYTLFSIAPLLVIAVAVAGAVFGQEAARGEMVTQIQGLLGKAGAEVVQTALANTQNPQAGNGIVPSIISTVALLFGASGVFIQLQDSLNAVWNVEPSPQAGVKAIVRKRVFSFAMVITIGFILMVSLVVSAALSALSTFTNQLVPALESFWKLFNLGISLGVFTLLFALIYKYLPDITIAWRDVLVGALFTSILFSVGKELLGLYLGNGSFGSAYGAAGSVVTVLAWIYYSVQIMLFGAEFTQVYTRKYGSHRGRIKHQS
ncbi:YihY/virulence factor BrkB family protein [Chamaesiphon minutus]|uniref:Putative membrane protein n=1 Tax=Chamaesiphon minutus (strain ATCC 27169 / PCC 6605) TaxID=1173020 RepID=K9UHH4_CHAP6|nr:YihY/virulence factor BrkB family protein [Chamaesiphon minutus]AFY93886.1 putative membrane protein [Chamaesiphon minutus PCC 6605]